MIPLAFPLLADENIHPDVVAGLRAQGKNITTVGEERLIGRSDLEVLRHAHSGGRVVVTHDGDFGTLAVLRGEPFTGVIYLRRGTSSLGSCSTSWRGSRQLVST